MGSVIGVLAPVALTGVETTATSNVITVDDTTGVYPGMSIFCPFIPYGSFVHAISGNDLHLYASVFDQTTGVWTTSADNAQASDSDTGLGAHAEGFNPVPVTHFYALGTWRNLTRSSVATPIAAGGTSGTIALANGYLNIPGVVTDLDSSANIGTGAFSITPTLTPSDDAAATPLRRHMGEPWSVWVFVSTGGLISIFPASNEYSVLLSSVL